MDHRRLRRSTAGRIGHWSFRRVAHMAVAAIAMASIVVTAWGLREFSQAKARVGYAQEISHEIQQMRLLLVDAETGQRGFVITGEEGYLAVYQAGNGKYVQAMARLTATIHAGLDPSLDAVIAKMSSVGFDKLVEMAYVIDVRRTAGFEAAQKRVLTHLGKNQMDSFRELSDQALAIESRQAAQHEDASSRIAFWTMIGLISVLTSMLVWVLSLGTDTPRRTLP